MNLDKLFQGWVTGTRNSGRASTCSVDGDILRTRGEGWALRLHGSVVTHPWGCRLPPGQHKLLRVWCDHYGIPLRGFPTYPWMGMVFEALRDGGDFRHEWGEALLQATGFLNARTPVVSRNNPGLHRGLARAHACYLELCGLTGTDPVHREWPAFAEWALAIRQLAE